MYAGLRALYFASAEALLDCLEKVTPSSVTGELYLTDIISIGFEESFNVDALLGSRVMAFGVNTQEQLSQANRLKVLII